MKPLKNKVALVTGASRGIGAAIAKRLAHDGATVAITYSSSPAKAKKVVEDILADGGNAIAIEADSGDAEAIKNAVSQTAATFGKIDILVNNAGILLLAPIEEFCMKDFDRLMAVNIKGVFVAIQETLRHMKHGGRIINIGSINSDSVHMANCSVYSLTKGAVASFTQGLAHDLGPRGITVNNIQPGPINTDMNPADSSFAGDVKKWLPLQRYGEAHEVASMAAYLVGPEASFITGAHFKIDGGCLA